MFYGKCKFDPCMFRHVTKEKDPEVEILKKKNEEVQKNIENIENSIRDLNKEILKSESIVAKLTEVEKKFTWRSESIIKTVYLKILSRKLIQLKIN